MGDPSTEVPGESRRLAVFRAYVALTAVSLGVHFVGYLQGVRVPDLVTAAFLAAACTVDLAIFVLPPALLLLALERALRVRWMGERAGAADGVFYAAAVVAFGALHVALFLDRFLYGLYGFHVNGFVWNLVTTPGGIDSMEAKSSTRFMLLLYAAGFVALQASLLWTAAWSPRLARWGALLGRRKTVVRLAAAALFLLAFEKVTYGISRFTYHAPVLAASDAIPLYIRLSLARPAAVLGFRPHKPEGGLHIRDEALRLRYPLHEIRRTPGARSYNLVWLVAESWRQDMLDPQITPAMSAFASRAVAFRHHYSGGNGTRMGMFAMFYGLYGWYWFPVLQENRGPVLVDLLQRENYQMELFTSAAFTYPEFDHTIFARVPADRLHEGSGDNRWQRDRDNVAALLDFVEGRDPSRPFFTFLFFESTHAAYNFPEECAIRTPYAADVNYMTMDVQRDAALLKNRYINASNHLDQQVGRILRRLEQRGLLDSTIVVITGDHGQEFMEKGHWGHNSAFTEEQTRSPLILWIPGRPARVVDRMTSHLDLPPTILTALGVANPPEDYCLGHDLLAGPERDFTIVFEWERIGYIDAEYKMATSLKQYDFSRRGVTTKDDVPVADTARFFETRKRRLLQVMGDLRRFVR